MRVLVVDDDEGSRYLVAALLKARGYDTVEARDGREALEKARAGHVDLVVSDILMPVMDGYSLLREWKADPALSGSPLVFYTASYTEPEDRRFAERLGADGFLVKPQEPEVLIAAIEEAIARPGADGSAGAVAPEPLVESEALRAHTGRLMDKLAKKVTDLDEANARLSRTIEVLSDELEVKKDHIEKLTGEAVDRERARDALVAANEWLTGVIDAAPVPIVVLDPELRVIHCNQGSAEILGVSPAEAAEESYQLLDETLDADGAPPLASLLRGDADRTEARLSGRAPKEAGVAELTVSAAAVRGAAGELHAVVCVIRETSRARRLEDARSAFAAMISHELRTPLTSVIGYTDLLEKTDACDQPERFREIAFRIREQGDRMRQLVDALLDVSLAQLGPLPLELERVDIGEFVRSQVERADVPDGRKVVFAAPDQEQGPALYIDRARMGRALQHLIANALKYSPDGGDVDVGVTSDGAYVRIAVTDRGIGIGPDDLELVFDRFTQADMSDTRQFGGMGVGLYLARQTVEAHRGRLDVVSAPGEGSTFTILLPVIA